MIRQRLLHQLVFIVLVFITAGCASSVTATDIPITPTVTMLPPADTSIAPTATLLAPTVMPLPPDTPTGSGTILGKITGLDGPVAGAEITLTSFEDEACVKLAESTSGLSEDEKKQLEECSTEVALINSDAEGQYKFTNLPSGWYSLHITWKIDNAPKDSGGTAGEFLVLYLDLNGEYFVFATQIKSFQLSVDESITKDLNLSELKP